MVKCISLVLLFVLATFSFAQEAQISYADGGEFALSSGGRRTTYKADKLNAEGLSLRGEDILQTGPGSFVELRLEPSGTRIKVAENTSLICKGRGPENGSLSFTLLYGRIRLSTIGGWSPDTGTPVYIDAGQAEAVFRQGDAGVDFLYSAAPSSFGKMEPVMRIYGFSGNVEVLPASADTELASRPRLSVPDYESVTIEVMNPFSFIERKPAENDIIQYWNHHNFAGSSRLLDPRTAAAPPAASTPASSSSTSTSASTTAAASSRDADRYVDPALYTYPDNFVNNDIKKVKNGMVISSIVFFVGGVGMQFAGQQRWGGMDGHMGESLTNYGYLQLGLGALLGISSLFVNQRNPQPNAAK